MAVGIITDNGSDELTRTRSNRQINLALERGGKTLMSREKFFLFGAPVERRRGKTIRTTRPGAGKKSSIMLMGNFYMLKAFSLSAETLTVSIEHRRMFAHEADFAIDRSQIEKLNSMHKTCNPRALCSPSLFVARKASCSLLDLQENTKRDEQVDL
jgi:hypothetical protein